MRSIVQSSFFIGYLLLFLLGMVTLLLVDYGQAVTTINAQRTYILDVVMPWVTHIGDGYFFAGVVLFFLFYKWRFGLFLGLAGVLQAAVSAFLKRIVFGKVPRPTKYFEERGVALDLVPNVDFARVFSFPSGHTMTVFMLTALLCFTVVPKRWHFLLLFVAVLGGFSRIYLLQHFLKDVVAGSMVGVMIAALMTAIVYPRLVLKQRR